MSNVEFLTIVITGFLFIFFLVFIALAMVAYVLRVIARWKIFKKAGEEGWKAIIPVYNLIILFKIIGLSPWLLFIYLAVFIPYIPIWAVVFGMSIPIAIKLAKAFKKDEGYIVGLVLLPIIFEMIIAFGKSEYVLNKEVKSEVVEKEEIKEEQLKLEEVIPEEPKKEE